ncbi:MAG: RluA family pseudouridine synthase [Proteobacteria bacterium]|nr:MAG: RluA family pseudouridine synthase [Pseudomonadota bacterium]
MIKSPDQNLDDDASFRSLGRPVGPEKAGERADFYLAKNFPFLSRAAWVKRLNMGEVLVDGNPVDRAYKLRLGQSLSFYHPKTVEPEVNRDIYPIWRVGPVMAVFKPAPLPMHENGAYKKNTFAELLKEEVGPEWAAVHRLDRETSGIVLCGATNEARKELSFALMDRTVQKEYLAITHGVPELSNWTETGAIGDLATSEIRIKKWVVPGGLSAETHFEHIEERSGYSLLRARPRTGRTNQIRIHSAYAGHHLVGDRLFYPDEDVFLDWFLNGVTDRIIEKTGHLRCLLHAHGLCFRHPENGKVYEVKSPLPDDMDQFWQKLSH